MKPRTNLHFTQRFAALHHGNSNGKPDDSILQLRTCLSSFLVRVTVSLFNEVALFFEELNGILTDTIHLLVGDDIPINLPSTLAPSGRDFPKRCACHQATRLLRTRR